MNLHPVRYVPAPSSLRFPLRVRLFPIVLFEIYLNLTVLLFAFGPWAWPVADPEKLYGFLLLAHLALLLGYLAGAGRQPRGYRGPLKLDTVVKMTLVFSVVWAIPVFYIRTQGAFGYSPSAIYESVVTGLKSLSGAYGGKSQVESLTARGASPLIRFSMVFLPITALLFPLCVVFWKRLSWKGRIAFLFAQAVEVLSWIAIGTTKGVADVCMVLPWLILAARPEILWRLSPKRVLKIVGVGLACVIITFLFFSAAKRPPRTHTRVPSIDAAHVRADMEHPLLSVVPAGQRFAAVQLSAYLTQGYYGLSLALDQPFVWCYGFGHGYWSAGAAARRFSSGGRFALLMQTYPGRVEQAHRSWEVMHYWHTIYPWIASDLSFPGTIVAVFVIGYLFALSWLDVLRRQNPFAIGVFALLVMMLFYFPMNNQVLSFYRTAIPFWVLVPLWLLTRRSG